MKKLCCVCGKKVRLSRLFGDTGKRLKDGVVCNDCCIVVGYEKDMFNVMDIEYMTTTTFISKYISSSQAPVNSLENIVRREFGPQEKIKAIKFVRDVTGWGLKEAKDFVDAM